LSFGSRTVRAPASRPAPIAAATASMARRSGLGASWTQSCRMSAMNQRM
jgi:hypothetical protein